MNMAPNNPQNVVIRMQYWFEAGIIPDSIPAQIGTITELKGPAAITMFWTATRRRFTST